MTFSKQVFKVLAFDFFSYFFKIPNNQSQPPSITDQPTKEEKAYVEKYQQEKLEYKDNKYSAGFP